MANIFSIDSSHIKAVDDETARELVARLCRAELKVQGLPEAAVTWGGDQRAKDVRGQKCCSIPGAIFVQVEFFRENWVVNKWRPGADIACKEQIYESLPCDSPVNRPAKLFKIIPDDFVE